MKYTHSVVDSINARKKGENTLSWIEMYGIYLCSNSKHNTIKNENVTIKNENVLVLSIENDDNLSVYDCYFKSKGERTKFCVNKAIESVPFAEISSLLKSVKCFERNTTQQYWNECFCKGQFDQIVADKKDTLQRSETKASSDPGVDLTMSYFLSELQNLVEEAIKEIAKTAKGWNKYDRIYIASADGKNTYPLVLPLKYTLYNLFETDSKKIYIWGETFREKDKEGNIIKKPLSSYKYDWKDCQQYFHIGALSRAIGLNVSLELTMNDLMKTDGIRVTFPLETGDDGSYTLPATPVLKECSSDNTKKISLSGVKLNWADLYENVQWDYKAGNHAFKHIKFSICADGCQRLYLMDGDKVLTVISSNGSTVEVENCLKVSNAEPAIIVAEPEIDVIDQTVSEPADNPTNVVVNVSQTIGGIDGNIVEPVTTTPYQPEQDSIDSKIKIVWDCYSNSQTEIRKLLEEIAKKFFREKYPNDNWKDKYAEAIDKKGSDHVKDIWAKTKGIEFSNFHCFLQHYKYEIIGSKSPKIERVPWLYKHYNPLFDKVAELIPVKNSWSHLQDQIAAIGKINLQQAFLNMKSIAERMKEQDVIEKISCEIAKFDAAFDQQLTEYWRQDKDMQEKYKLFEETRLNKL